MECDFPPNASIWYLFTLFLVGKDQNVPHEQLLVSVRMRLNSKSINMVSQNFNLFEGNDDYIEF